MEITSTSPAVAKVPPESSEDTSSSSETDSEEEKLTADVEEVELVVSYLEKVTPEIAREFQVSLMGNNFLF